MRRLGLLWIGVYVILPTLGCAAKSGQDLNRAVAAQLIKSSSEFEKRPIPSPLKITKDSFSVTAYSEKEKRQSWCDTNFKNTFAALLGLGWATVEPIVENNFMHCTAVLTAKGQDVAKQYQWQEPGRYQGEQDAWSVPAGGSEFLEVTGITDGPLPSMKTAEFSWRYVPTEFAKLYGKQLVSAALPSLVGASVPDSQPRTGAATFQKYDDGWRLESLSWGG